MLIKSEVKYIQTLFQKKFRDIENCYLIEGPKIVEEALNNPGTVVKKIFAVEEWVKASHAGQNNVATITVEAFELEKISQLKTPNQVVAIVEKPTQPTPPSASSSLLLALDGIQDPGNMGTIIRIADWFGIPAIICSTDSADVYNGKVVQSTMGSIFRVPVFYAGLPEWINNQESATIYGAVLNGTPLKEINAVTKGVLVIGNESKGIRPELETLLTQKITIAKIGQAESLNAAVATGILLSHLK